MKKKTIVEKKKKFYKKDSLFFTFMHMPFLKT